ncbi:hypothetical protein GCM10023194_31290 [Planotetraspora phitsanulokensis]|uniref:Uncharacterized protein n=1 Tax=Planotetraspora phitsanulokensis TaxID=575192 RepID=A0A8J3XGN6_9ACTN|nr:hypothetical protein [Planotetraspora phitsanulokensis]GII35733.1 hypothetical protein Pph01_07360 [Planotetraspora phitsanulokensis]
MNAANGDNGFLYELEIEVEEEVTLVETSRSEEAAELPVTEWLFDPADADREEMGLRGLLGAVEALEGDHRPEEPRA